MNNSNSEKRLRRRFRATIGLSSWILSLMTTLLMGRELWARDFRVISVYRPLAMKNGDETYKDYYVDAGSNNGLKKGAFIEALRKASVYDHAAQKVIGDTQFPIAKMRVIHLDKAFAIARVVKATDPKTEPQGDVHDVLVGDTVRVAEEQK